MFEKARPAVPCPVVPCPALPSRTPPCPAVRASCLEFVRRRVPKGRQPLMLNRHGAIRIANAHHLNCVQTSVERVSGISTFMTFVTFSFLPSESNLTKVLVTKEKSLATSSQTYGMFLMVNCQNFFHFSRVSTLLSYAIITYGYLFGTIFKMRLTKKLFKQWSLFHFYLWSGAYQK